MGLQALVKGPEVRLGDFGIQVGVSDFEHRVKVCEANTASSPYYKHTLEYGNGTRKELASARKVEPNDPDWNAVRASAPFAFSDVTTST